MKASELRIPENYTEFPDAIMSNFDHCIEESIAEEIKGKPIYSQYSAWNFCGYVWWQNEKWNCEVWTYGSWNKTVSAETLREIMDDVSDEFGSE